MPTSHFADQLLCAYCDKPNQATSWPRNGDMVPFYFRTKENFNKDPGFYRIPMHCPHCGKDWYIVWEEDPHG